MEDWFAWFDNRPIVKKAKIDWPRTLDFKVQGKFIVGDIRACAQKVKKANDSELLFVSQHCFNLLSWIDQMGIMGFESLRGSVDCLLEDAFGKKSIIQDIQKSSFRKWMRAKRGQYKIGENYFNIYHNTIYYRTLRGQWHSVNQKDVFTLMPVLQKKPAPAIIEKLEREYLQTKYDKIFQEWQKSDYSNTISHGVLTYQRGETTPEKQLHIALKKIREILKKPVSYAKTEAAHHKGDRYLEYLIKVGFLMLEFVQKKRKSHQHTLYLLRDCIVFFELQKTLDLIEKKRTSCDQLIIGRKLLSNKKREGGHWYFIQEALFYAYQRYPHNYRKFYHDFSRMVKEYTEYNKEFAGHMKNLAIYIKKHIVEATKKKLTIEIVDLGFQGSINILVKYIIDNYLTHEKRVKTDIHMYVLAEWFKTVYSKKYTSETYSLLTHIESLARNEYYYSYKMGSFTTGTPTVIMGRPSDQREANIELLIFTTVAILAKKLRIL